MTEAALVKVSPQEAQIVNLFIQTGLNAVKVGDQLGMDIEAVHAVLTRDHVRTALGIAMLAEKHLRVQGIKNELVQMLFQLTTYDIAEAFDKEGMPYRNIRDIPISLRRCIKSWKMGKYGPEFTFYDAAQVMLSLLNLLNKSGTDVKEEEKTVLEVPMDDE